MDSLAAEERAERPDQYTYEDVRKAGKQLVAKRNDFIQASRFNLSLLQNKIFLYMISKIRPGDTQDKVYEYRYSELFAVLRYKTDSYQRIRKIIQGMNALSFWQDAENEDEDDQLISFFESDSVSSNWKKGYFKVKYGKKIFPYLLELRRQKEDGFYFTTYSLENVILMDRYYSQRLYEILKSYQYNNQTWWFELGTGTKNDLHRRIAVVDAKGSPIVPKGWQNWHIFDRDVLTPAMKDINRYTDIQIAYEPSKTDRAGVKHRRYVIIRFALKKKTHNQLEEREKIIDGAYQEWMQWNRRRENGQYHQSTLFEFLDSQERRQSEEELESQKQKQREWESELDLRCSKSPYPVFTSVFGRDFTDEELAFLYDAACRKTEPGVVDYSSMELFAVDYVDEYYNYVKATEGSTQTSVYKRLLNMIRHDYEALAPRISAKYAKTKYYYGRPAVHEQEILEEEFTQAGSSVQDGVKRPNLDEEEAERLRYYIDAFSRL